MAIFEAFIGTLLAFFFIAGVQAILNYAFPPADDSDIEIIEADQEEFFRRLDEMFKRQADEKDEK